MKITLTDEQVNTLIEAEITKRENEYSNRFNKELLKVQSQLTDALSLVNALLENHIKTKKEKLTPELFIKLWNEGKKNSEIANETGYNAGYISLMKKKLIVQGKIKEQKK